MSRSAEINRARDQLKDVLTRMMLEAEKPGRPVDEAAQQATSAMAAGLSILVGIALDLDRMADALERLAAADERAPPEPAN